MTSGAIRGLRTIALLLCATAVLAGAAEASLLRPNALDHRVDLLPNAQLLVRSATALVDPERQAAATRLARWLLPGWFVSLFAQIFALAYFWQSGMAAKLRDWLRRRIHSEFAVRLLFGAALALIAKAAALIPDFYIFRVDRVMGLNDQLLRAWSVDWLINTLLAMASAGVVAATVLWLVDRTHQWYLYTMAAMIAGSLAIAYVNPILFAPIFNPSQKLPVRFARDVAVLESRTSAGRIPVIIETRSPRTRVGSVEIQGLGPTTRIVLSDALVAGTSPPERIYIVAHELASIEDRDPLRTALVDALFVILGSAIAVFVADRIGFRRDDDAVARLALVAALLGCVYVVVAPIDNALARRASMNADRTAVVMTGDRADAVRSIVRATDQGIDEVCPGILTRLFLDRVPAPGERISAITGAASGCP